MKLRLVTLPIVCCFGAALAAQSNVADTPIYRTGTRVVVVDVVVTDKAGNPVANLPKGVFHVTEDGKPQTVTHFNEHHASEARPLPAQPPSPPGVYSNLVQVDGDSPLTVVMLDLLNTPITDQMYARKQLQHFVKTLRPGSRVAVVALTTKLVLLQGFTSDPQMLAEALNNKRSARQSTLLDNEFSTDLLSNYSADQSVVGNATGSLDAAAEASTFRNRLRIQYTLEAFNQLARFLAGFPGRKNVVWFSGAFPISALPSSSGGDTFSSALDLDGDVRATTYLMSVAQIAIYPVDTRGVIVPSFMSAENSSAAIVGNGRTAGSALMKFNERVGREQMVMRQMAEDTGGKVTLNNNDLSDAVRRAMNDGANYYTLDYTPTDHKLDGDFHAIHVEMQAPGYRLSYRRGYYAEVGEAVKTERGRLLKSGTKSNTSDSMRFAMQHGAPSLMQVLYRERFTPLGTDTGGSLVDSVAAQNEISAKLHGPFRNYELTYAADAQTVSAPVEADGRRHTHLQFTALVYSNEGDLLNALSNQVDTALTDAEYTSLLQHGIQMHQIVSVPAKGDSYIRTGIRDVSSNRIGTLEVPAVRLRSLPAMSAVKP